MIHLTDSIKMFREKLKELSYDELLEILKKQDPKLVEQVQRIHYVFDNNLQHLRWEDGSPVEGRKITKEELIRLIDPPYIHSSELEKAGFTDAMQRQIHIASDPVLWVRNFLGAKPRVYQILVLRDLNPKRVMRFGRRLGKTWSIAAYILWFCYTQKKVNALVVAPMKSHVGLIYDEIMNMVNGEECLPIVKEAVIRNVASPQYEINFSNGSNVRLFTTGVKSNNKSAGTRGQEAHLIIADEMDYMGPDDLNALYAMLQKTSDNYLYKKILIGASTPTGKRDTFWDWNTNKALGFTPYWFPSYCNPHWDMDTEILMHQQYPDINVYRQEVEADWGEPAEGVYPRTYVDLAFQHDVLDDNDKVVEHKDWKYIPDRTSARSEFVFGVDWDKYGAGVNVVVLEICNKDYEDQRFAGKIRVAYREEIIKQEYTYVYAVDRIKELNSIFRPKHIYVDRGAGEVQIELLHKEGLAHPESSLHTIVKGFQFAESVEVMDPFNQQKVRKKLKAFMIDNLYRMLQEQRIFMPGSDEELYLQIIGYIVTKQNAYGEPVFGPSPGTVDHAHDALILACYAVADNYDELLNPSFASKSISVSNEAFLPLFSIESKADELKKEVMEERGIEVPTMATRSMAHGIRKNRGSFSNSRTIRRKMW
jgi:hypothetical protein